MDLHHRSISIRVQNVGLYTVCQPSAAGHNPGLPAHHGGRVGGEGARQYGAPWVPYGRHGYNWSLDPAHWSHFLFLCLHQVVAGACGPAEYDPEHHIRWHSLD